jgi:hypothetical protein
MPLTTLKKLRLLAVWSLGCYLALIVDVAWITVYLVALLWIAVEWWPFRRPRLLRGPGENRGA